MDKKRFGWFQLVELFVMIAALLIACGVVAWRTSEEELPRMSLFADLMFGFSAFVVSSVTLLLSIESYRRELKIRREKLEEEAKTFLNENSEDRSYIPLCVIANAFDNHRKFSREIYNRFCVLNVELQQEILKQAKYDYPLFVDNKWIDESIEVVKSYIEKNDLGSDYFSSAFGLFAFALEDDRANWLMSDKRNRVGLVNWKGKEPISFESYIDDYLKARKVGGEDFESYKEKQPLREILGDGSATVSNVDIYSRAVFALSHVAEKALRERLEKIKTGIVFLSANNARLERVEDGHLYLLLNLYNIYLAKQKVKKAFRK